MSKWVVKEMVEWSHQKLYWWILLWSVHKPFDFEVGKERKKAHNSCDLLSFVHRLIVN